MNALLQELTDEGVLRTPRIVHAFQHVPREAFLPPHLTGEAEVNAPLPIGHGQTISQPLTVAIMLELLQPKRGDQVLDVGAGSGWTAALLADIVGPQGKVIALERIPELKRFGEANVSRLGLTNVTFHLGDGSQGFPDAAPYNAIHVAAAASEQVPTALREQLAVGGTLVIPVGQGVQDLVRLRRQTPTDWVEDRTPGFQFVPLIEG